MVAKKLKVLSTLDGTTLLFIVNGKNILYLFALNEITPLWIGEKISRKQPPSLIVQKQVCTYNFCNNVDCRAPAISP